MSFITVDLNNVDLSGPDVLKFVLADENTVLSYSHDPEIKDYKKIAARPDINAFLEDGSAAVQTLVAVKRHNYDVVRNRVVQSSVYADEFFSQNVSILFRPWLFVKDNTADDIINKITSLFNDFIPQAGIDPEEYVKNQSVTLGVPADTVTIVAALVFVRQGKRVSDSSQIKNLFDIYDGVGVRAYPDPKDKEGVGLNLNKNGYSLIEWHPDDLDYLPQPIPSQNKFEFPKGDQGKEDLGFKKMHERLADRYKKMDCGEKFQEQKWKAAEITLAVETKIDWEVREVRGDCFRIEIRVPVLKSRRVNSVLYVITANPIDVVGSVLLQTLSCAIKSALDVRVVGLAFINIAAAIAAYGGLFESCIRYHEGDLLCVVPDLALVTEIENDWH